MKAMILFYETAIDHCIYPENKLGSSIYLIDMPCIHRMTLCVEFPPLPNIKRIPTLDFSIHWKINKKIKKCQKKKILAQRRQKNTMDLVKFNILAIHKIIMKLKSKKQQQR